MPAERAAQLPVLVVGCGESGILGGVRLKQANIPFTIVEKNAGPGGTWWENRYPGARVDVANHFYCYSFEPNNDWTHFFAEQNELQDYFTKVIDEHDLADRIRWQTEVLAAQWDDDDGTWTVSLRSADGRTSTLRARALITAVGQLNRPNIPEFAGAQTFRGPSFHSAAWDHSVDLKGKRVALVGAGASGFQIAPAIAEEVERLTVFQRTAQWMFPNPMYHDEVGDGVRWAMRHLPFYGRWYRFLVLWPGSDKGLDAAEGDPNYADQDHAVSDINAGAHMMFSQWITSQVGEDSPLLAKVMPDYPACGKRTLQDNGSWLRTLQRDNVELVRTPIDRITPQGIVTEDGVTHDVDVIVYATGFRHTDVLWPLKITGRNGVDLHEMWGAGRMPTSGSPSRSSRTSSSSTAPEPTWPTGQPDLPVRTADALHRPMPGAPGRRRCALRRAETRRRHGLAPADADPDQEDGVVTPGGQALVFQERRRRDSHRQPVAPQRVLVGGA